MSGVALYDAFSGDYDRFVNWPGRLAAELPFIERQLAAAGARRVLDVACATGRHAIALAGRNYQVVGADLSAAMVEQARANAAAAGLEALFHIAGFGELAVAIGGPFDALLCLGNSLPHLLETAELTAALADFSAVLRPGGVLMIQNRNFDAVAVGRLRWMDPQSHREGEREWVFLRFYDFNPDGALAFNVITLRREGDLAWEQRVETTYLRPWQSGEMESAVRAAGFRGVALYGDMTGADYSPANSPNLVLTAYMPG